MLLLVRGAQVDVLIIARIVRRDDSCVVSVCPTHEYSAPSAKAFVVASNLPDVSCAFSKTDCACAVFLYPSCIFVLVNVVRKDSRTCQFLLKHLFEVILVVLVVEIKLVLAIH